MALTVKQIETALTNNGGFVSQAAKKLNVSYQAIYKRIKNNKRLQEIKLTVEESNLDLAESKLLTQIRKGNLGAICFYLKCKGKKRGYIETQQMNNITDAPPQPIKIEFKSIDGRVTKDGS